MTQREPEYGVIRTMETLGVVGVSFRRDGSDVLSRFTINKEKRVERLPELALAVDAEEILYLATCNRVEVAFKGRPGVPFNVYRRRIFRALAGRDPNPGEAERTFRAWAGEGAVEHLFLVAGGFDSAQVGEQEIRAQFREALKMARAAGVVGALLSQVVSEALRLAAEIHGSVDTDGQKTSLADVACGHLISRVRRTPGVVALIGVSPMTIRAAHVLVQAGVEVLLVNRRVERACELAERLMLDFQTLDDFRQKPRSVEALLTATGSPQAILGLTELERIVARAPSGEPQLVIDMAVPEDVDPLAAQRVGVERLGMDDITSEAEATRNRRLLDLAPAREMVDRRLEKFCRQLNERAMAPVIARLNQRYRQTAVEGLDRLFSKQLGGIAGDDREVITRWAEVMARRFAHIPTMGIRALASDYGAPAVRTFLQASGEDLYGDAAAFPEEDPAGGIRGGCE